MNTENYTAAQRAAIESDAKQILCVAGPGSGKTTVLTQRIRRLVESGVPAAKIVAITYTNAAAREIEERVARAEPDPDLDEQRVRNLYPLEWEADDAKRRRFGFIGTLHGFALRMLREHGTALGYGARTAIIDEDAALDLLQSKARSLKCKTPIDKLVEAKRRGRPLGGTRLTLDETVLCAYFDELKEAGIVDFDLILSEFHALLCAPEMFDLSPDGSLGFSHLFVDEVQDSADVDWKIYRELPMRNKFLVGDPDQAIYGFRGGRVDLMAKFAKEPETTVITLAENFRCAGDICRAANNLIRHNCLRIPKDTISATGKPGGVASLRLPLATEGEEIAHVIHWIDANSEDWRDNQIAVLARTNALAGEFREALKAAGVPVVEPPKSEMPRDWAFCRAALELAASPTNELLTRLYLIEREISLGMPRPGAVSVADAMIRSVRASGRPACMAVASEWAERIADIGQLTQWLACSLESRMLVASIIKTLPAGATLADLALAVARLTKPDEENAAAEGVTCTTLHSAKGREWDVVFLVGFEDEVHPGIRRTPIEIEEERRLVFVGLTRARSTVIITSSKTRRATWGNKPILPRTPSRFLKEIFP